MDIVTPTQRALHEAHLARQAKFAAPRRWKAPPAITPDMPAPPAAPVARRKLPPVINRAAVIIETVAAAYQVSSRDLKSPARFGHLIEPRYIAIYLLLDLTHQSTPIVGRWLNRDHSTVFHARDKIETQLTASAEFRSRFVALRQTVIDAIAAWTPHSWSKP